MRWQDMKSCCDHKVGWPTSQGIISFLHLDIQNRWGFGGKNRSMQLHNKRGFKRLYLWKLDKIGTHFYSKTKKLKHVTSHHPGEWHPSKKDSDIKNIQNKVVIWANDKYATVPTLRSMKDLTKKEGFHPVFFWMPKPPSFSDLRSHDS